MRAGGEEGGVAEPGRAVVERDGPKVEEGGEDELYEGDDEPAVDDELRERRRAQVAVSPMPQHEAGEVRELRDREVGGERRLPPLAPLDADAHVGGVDHADVVAAVADGRGDLARVLAEQPHLAPRAGEEGLMRGRPVRSCSCAGGAAAQGPPSASWSIGRARVRVTGRGRVRRTMSAFCVGEHRQTTTVGAAHATSMKRWVWCSTQMSSEAPSRKRLGAFTEPCG